MNVDRQVAMGDLVLFTPLALPWIGAWILGLLLQLNSIMGWPGAGTPDVLAGLLVNLLGLFGVCFALLRLRLGPETLRREAILVKAAAAVLILIAIGRGAPAVLAVIAVADIVAAVLLRLRGGSTATA